MTDRPFDEQAAHRWFAVNFNNAAWDLVENTPHSPEECERVLHLAHAACLHWLAVGSPLNHQRAMDLLAHAYASAGHGTLAIYYADRCVSLSRSNATIENPFDHAAALACMSHALRANGQREAASDWQERCWQAAVRLPPEERDLIKRLAALGDRH